MVGRDAEIERALDVLAKRHANNACLIGAPGVGKTSVVRGLAVRIANGDDVACFEDKILVGIEPAAMLAGTGVRGSLAERIGQLKTEIARAKGRVILFFDEMHVLFGQDAGDEASSELRLALARGEIVCIGATTEMDYRRVIDADPGLSRCFTPIEVCELSRRGGAARDRGRSRRSSRSTTAARTTRTRSRRRSRGACAICRARRCPTRPCRSSISPARARGVAADATSSASTSPRW